MGGMNLRIGIVASLVAVAGLTAGCGEEEMVERNQLIIGISQFPEGFHPTLFSHVAQSLVLGASRRPLTTYDAEWQLICMLCEALPDVADGTAREWISSEGEEGWELDYKIRDDAVWADGTPVTTRDVLFTWEIGRHPESGVAASELYTDIEKIEAHDDRRFTLFNKKRSCDYQGINDFELIPAHIDEANFAEPREYRTRSAFETDTTNPGLYMGPYMVTALEFGASITLERNPNWWGKTPRFDRVIFKIIENTAALEANLLSGDIDYIAGEDGITLDQALAFEAKHGEDYNVVFRSGLIYEHIDLRQEDPILSDIRVRRALAYGADREGIAEQLFKGHQPVAHGAINPLDEVYYDGVPKYGFDPVRAAELLDEAGWTELRDGVRHNAAGDPLTIEIMTTAGNRVRETVEQILQSMWRDIGVDLRIRNEPARVFFGQTTRQRRFHHMAMYAWVSAPKSIPLSTLHSTMIPTVENNYSGQNYPGYASDEMDEVIDRLQVECAEATQTELWNRLQTLYAEDLPVLPLYFRANVFVMPHWLKGVEPTGHQYPSTLWIENWHVAEDE
ncbi:MAG: peptide ABC transporter substrate-binding protein [Alphaproteobacteria bacterium]|nr:peptide ABC transporter substrate-binding protein [Alphaproteobacteria bacterium]